MGTRLIEISGPHPGPVFGSPFLRKEGPAGFGIFLESWTFWEDPEFVLPVAPAGNRREPSRRGPTRLSFACHQVVPRLTETAAELESSAIRQFFCVGCVLAEIRPGQVDGDLKGMKFDLGESHLLE